MENETVPTASVYLTRLASQKLDRFAANVGGEIGGFGYAHIEDGEIVVSDVFLVAQEVSATSVEYDDDAVAEAVECAAQDDRAAELRFSWHSHADMSAYFSETDKDTIETCLGLADWVVSAVINRKGERACRVDFYRPIRATAAASLYTLIDKEIDDDARAEIEQKVKVKKKIKTLGYQKHKGIEADANKREWYGDIPLDCKLDEYIDYDEYAYGGGRYGYGPGICD